MVGGASRFGLLYLERRPARRRERLLPLVSPFRRRVLFTVAAAMRFATRALRPRPFADRLIFSYCLSRLLLQDFGIRISFRAGTTHSPQSARNLCIRLLGRKGEKQENQRQQLDHRGERVERRGAAEPIVPGT